MHPTIFIHALLLGGRLTPRIHAQPQPNGRQPNGPVGMDAIFELAQGGFGECDAEQSEELLAQFPNMQKATGIAAAQIPDRDTITSPRTLPLMQLEFATMDQPTPNIFPYSRRYISMTLEYGNTLLKMPRSTATGVTMDVRTFVLCDSLGVLWKLPHDPLPWYDPGAPTVGDLYTVKDRDKYFYFYVPLADAIGRVPKAILPPIPEDDPDAGAPFRHYPPPMSRQFGPSFCSDHSGQSWGFTLSRFARAKLNISRGIIVLCPGYFEEKKLDVRLPAEIDTYPQVVGTELESMKPAWFAWSCAVFEVARLLRARELRNPKPLWPSNVKYYNFTRNFARPQDINRLPAKRKYTDQARLAITADECILLSLWQMGKSISRNLNPRRAPAIFNPPNYVWFIIAVYLQEVPDSPQDWGTGIAEDIPPPTLPCNEGGDDGGQDSGGGGGGDGVGGRKRPRPDEEGNGGGGKRPRIAAGYDEDDEDDDHEDYDHEEDDDGYQE